MSPATPKTTGLTRALALKSRPVKKRDMRANPNFIVPLRIRKRIDNQHFIASRGNFGVSRPVCRFAPPLGRLSGRGRLGAHAGTAHTYVGIGLRSAQGADCRGQSAYAGLASLSTQFGGHS